MAYDYIKRAYGIEPIVGQPVRLKNYPAGKVARENMGQSHYVMVRFEGWDHDAPVHPHDLEYLEPDDFGGGGLRKLTVD